MANAKHSTQQPSDGIHLPYAWTFADAAARAAGTPVDGPVIVAGDVGKLARQLDDNTLWLLTGFGPLVWVAVTGTGGGSTDFVRRDGTLDFTGSQSMGGLDLTNARTLTFDTEFDNGNPGAGFALDWGNGQKQRFTLDENTTITVTDPPGVGNFTLKIISTGNFAITWPASFLWPNGNAPNLTNAGTDIVAAYFDGTNYYAVASLNFS